MKVSFQEKARLVEKLLACPTIKNRKSRETVLKQLRDRISDTVQDDPQSLVHVTNIVDACLNYSGGLEELIDIVFYYEKDSHPMQELDEVLQEISPKVIKPSHLRELKSIVALAEWPLDFLIESYRASAPQGWALPKGNDEAELCVSMLGSLAEAPCQENGNVPLLIFVEHLASYMDTDSSSWKTRILAKKTPQAKLRKWIHTIAKEQGFEKPQISTNGNLYKPSPKNYAMVSPYLLIKVIPNDIDEDCFIIQSWLLDGGYKVIDYLYANDDPVSFQHLPNLLQGFLVQTSFHLMEAVEDLTVEFCLPRRLLCSDVDHWIVTAGRSTPVKIGIQHRVIVRSLERAHNMELWPSWKSKWSRLQSQRLGSGGLDGSVAPFLICNEEDCENQESLYARLRNYYVICLALALIPPDLPLPRADILDTVLDAGIPIALWPRHCVDHLQASLDSLLSGCDLSELPKLVWKLRLEAASKRDEGHLGHRLTLLWDDPDRLPPDVQPETQRFKAPYKKGS